jgi:DNA polymerase
MKVDMPPDQAETIVQYYRKKYFKISGTWNHLQQVALPVLAGNGNKFTIGPCEFEKNAVMLPSGLRLHYYDLRLADTDLGRQWIFSYGEEPKALYGGKLLENMVQALARIHTMDAALRIQKSIGLGMQVHDELVYSIPEDDIAEAESILMEEMIRPPSWAPGLPLAAEVGVGPSYGDAK